MAVAPEKIYQAVKTGRVKVDDLNEESKQILRDYVLSKQAAETEPVSTPQSTGQQDSPVLTLDDARTVDGKEVTNFLRHPIKAIQEAWTRSGEDLKAGKLQMSPEEIQERMVSTGLAPSTPGETTGFANVVQRGIQDTMMLNPEWDIPKPTTGNKAADLVGELAGMGLGFVTGPANIGPAGGLLKGGAIGEGNALQGLISKTGSPALYKWGGKAVQGASMGATYGTGKAIANDVPLPEIPLEAAKEAALWAAMDVGGSALLEKVVAPRAKALFKAIAEKKPKIEAPLPETFRTEPRPTDFTVDPGGRAYVGKPLIELPEKAGANSLPMIDSTITPESKVWQPVVKPPVRRSVTFAKEGKVPEIPYREPVQAERKYVPEPVPFNPRNKVQPETNVKVDRSVMFERMMNDIAPDVEAEITKVYAPGYRPSNQQFEKFIRDAAKRKGYDFDRLAAEAGYNLPKEEMTMVEGRALSPEEKQLNILDKEIKNTTEYIDSYKMDVKKAAREASGEGNVYAYVKSRGGIRPSESLPGEYNESIPLALKNKDGMPLDELASELGMDSRQLLDELSKPRSNAFNPEVAVANDPALQAIEKTVGTLNSEKEALVEQINRPRVKNPDKYGTVEVESEADKIVNFFEEAERAARDRIKSRKGRLLSGPPIDDIADYAVIGAAKIAKGTVKFSQWSAEMLKEYGSKVEPYLKDIYGRAKKLHGRYVNGDRDAIKQIESVRNPEVKSAPKTTPKAQKTQTKQALKDQGAGDADTFRAKINREVKDKPKTFREVYDQLKTQFVDSVAPFEKLEKNIRGKVASAEESLYKTARLFKGNPEKANEIIRTELNPVIKSIEDKGYTYQDLGDYALAVHAKDVNAKGINSGFTDTEINAVINKYSGMESARKELVEVSGRLLDDLADAGRISTKDVQLMKEKWPNYMPLFRSFDDAKIEFGKGLSDSFANVANPIKKLEGSSRDVIDPIENMIKNIFKITHTADRSRVGKQLLKLADEDVSSQFVRKLREGEEVGRKNVLTLYDGGKKVQVEVQPDIYKAMLDMDKETSNALIEILSKPASTLRAGATLTPEFALRNPMRDVFNAFVVSESGFRPWSDFPVSLAQAIFKGRKIKFMGKEYNTPGELYTNFLKDNGGYGNIVSMDRKVHRQALEKTLKQPASKKFINIVNPKSWVEVLRAISDTTETATKLGEYRAAIRKGETRQEAAYRARDLMDFARAGTSVKQANKIVAFLNANIQGKSKLIRAIKANPTKVTAKAALAVTLPTIGVYVAQKTLANDVQKQNIKDAPNWLKDTFWLIPVPGTNQVARVPKPFDLAPIFSNPVERFLDYIVENDPEAFDGYVKRTLSEFSVPVMITGLTPFIEGMANYSFFRQAPVIPQREQGLRYQDQQDINTSETAKLLAKGVEKITGGEGTFKNFSSPRVMDNTILGTTAGLGRYVTNAVDVLLKDVVDKPEKPKKLISQKPVLRAFLVNENSAGESVDELYEERDKLTRAKNSARLNKEPFRDGARLKRLESAARRISLISKRIRSVENSSKLTGKQKTEMIKKLSADRNNIARDIMKK